MEGQYSQMSHYVRDSTDMIRTLSTSQDLLLISLFPYLEVQLVASDVHVFLHLRCHSVHHYQSTQWVV